MPLVTTPAPTLPPPATDSAAGMDSAERIMVMAALAGDDEAFETVIRTYSRRIYVVAYAIVQDVSEAEDIVQDTFLKAHRQRRSLRDPEKFPAWLLTVTRNAARDRLRRRRPQADAETFDTLVDPAATPGSALEQEERQVHLRRALATLPEEHRTALTLRYLEGHDYRTIETTMGLSNGALRGILGRALGTLRRMPALKLVETP
ncbi:MAG: RNA polymerase sigma factor [Methylacidiphilales bacterium]|nr:RNA polymerase sigma factor [Candidatus Methylacidiphilales bacterium]